MENLTSTEHLLSNQEQIEVGGGGGELRALIASANSAYAAGDTSAGDAFMFAAHLLLQAGM